MACSLTLEPGLRFDAANDRTAADLTMLPDGPGDEGPQSDALDGSQDGGDTIIPNDTHSDGFDVADSNDGNIPTDATDASDGCVRRAEICNGLDDDCDGVIDNNIAAITCGRGACARAVPGCISGMVPACVEGPMQPEVCNGVDDDCDGTVDNNIPIVSCGIGACTNMLPSACISGSARSCTPLPVPGVADTYDDGIDNDCNGIVDDGCECARYVRLGSVGTGLSESSPAGSIQSMIDSMQRARERGRICVAAVTALPGGVCARTVYPENITMSDGISVFGGYNGNSWLRDPMCPTIIQSVDSNAQGLLFPPSTTLATQLDGFIVRALETTSGGSVPVQTASITMQGTGTLTNNSIDLGLGTTVLGIHVLSTMGVATLPPVISNNRVGVNALSGALNSVGIRVQQRSARIQQNPLISGGIGTAVSTGIEGIDASGTLLADNVIQSGPTAMGGTAGSSLGLRLAGNSSGVVVTRNTIQGAGPGTNSMISGRGVLIEGCIDGAATTPVIFDNASIVGSNGGGSGIGVEVVGPCRALIHANRSIVGKTAVGGDARGIQCRGSNASCTIANNGSIEGFAEGAGAGTAGRGIAINTGATGRINNNPRVTGCTRGINVCHGIALEDPSTATSVDGNTIPVMRAATFCTGILARNTVATISNNVVFDDTCNGISVDIRGGDIANASIVNNTVIRPAGLGDAARVTNLVMVDNETTTPRMVGVFRNNLLVCLSPANSVAFGEAGANADPRVFENNNLFGCVTLYRNEGTTSLTTIAAVNALTDIMSNANNLSVDPLFVAAGDFHLARSSPVLNMGTGNFAPPWDFDRELRPAIGGFDIGADEVSGP